VLVSCSQKKDRSGLVDHNNYVSFIDTIDILNATKDGIYINGYVVELDLARIEELNGKKVKISGKIYIERGIENDSLTDQGFENKETIIKQGRLKDIKHIENPEIEIVE
jgi:hypothetical protein